MESHIAVVVGEIEARHDDGVACTTEETGSNKKGLSQRSLRTVRQKGLKEQLMKMGESWSWSSVGDWELTMDGERSSWSDDKLSVPH